MALLIASTGSDGREGEERETIHPERQQWHSRVTGNERERERANFSHIQTGQQIKQLV
jgi:hypothetical protein